MEKSQILGFCVKKFKKDFPFFRYNDIVYCDNAATTQKPQAVINRLVDFYTKENASVYRGFYHLAENATEKFEAVREQVKDFIGAHSASEIVFTSGATEGINTVAFGWGRHNLCEGDEIVLSELEHHSQILPWQQLAHEKKLRIRWIPATDQGDLDYTSLNEIVNQKTRIVAISACSNVTGMSIDFPQIIQRARAVGARVLLDASQYIPHTPLDVYKQKCDFLVFSAHKMLGPTGLGILFVKEDIHSSIEPYTFGGGMVLSVSHEKAFWRDMPHRCEAGTPPIAQVVAFGEALRYYDEHIDFEILQKHEAFLCSRLIDGLTCFKEVRILGSVDLIRKNGHTVSFTVEGFHAQDVAEWFDRQGIAVRSGHHCAQLFHEKLQCVSSVRVSFYIYNTIEDVDKILIALKKLLG